MRLFLLSKFKKDFWYEVLSYDKEKHLAVICGPDRKPMIDIQFHLDMIKRCYTLTNVQPVTKEPA